ncbi:MAG: uroporphyrinogen decarboxylase family protein [Dethiobacteraceae bacterium]|jgi:hypothetical protein|nr:hypothetical protein [Bacillota bacterium]
MGRDVKFSQDELKVKEMMPQMFGPPVEVFTTPITPRENTLLLYQGKTPMWAPFAFGEHTMIMVDCDPENQARSSKEGGIDGYGVEWVFVEVVGGAIVKPGNPKVKDINEWEKYVTIPDPDTWDWEGCYERNKDKLSPERATYIAVPGCLFERLIAVMDFDKAAMALIDEDQKESVHRFFRAVTDVHKKFYTNVKKWFNPDIVNFNDDWGSQRSEFFKVETVREMLLPYVKEIVDHVHSLGMYMDLHCCGFVERFVPLFIEAGFDSWGGQPINDKYALKQKYGDQMIFTDGPVCPEDATEEEMDAAVADFMAKSGSDNRVLVDLSRAPKLRAKMYEATRRNYDRLVAEGKAIL